MSELPPPLPGQAGGRGLHRQVPLQDWVMDPSDIPTAPRHPAPRKLTNEEYDDLIATPDKFSGGVPTLYELDHALSLIMKRHTIEAWYLRRRLKWLVKVMNKEYGIGWQTPWDKRR